MTQLLFTSTSIMDMTHHNILIYNNSLFTHVMCVVCVVCVVCVGGVCGGGGGTCDGTSSCTLQYVVLLCIWQFTSYTSLPLTTVQNCDRLIGCCY